jgi:hypothetical protein
MASDLIIPYLAPAHNSAALTDNVVAGDQGMIRRVFHILNGPRSESELVALLELILLHDLGQAAG